MKAKGKRLKKKLNDTNKSRGPLKYAFFSIIFTTNFYLYDLLISYQQDPDKAGSRSLCLSAIWWATKPGTETRSSRSFCNKLF